MSLANYSGIQICVRPVLDGSTYEFVVENNGGSTLWHLIFSTYEMLGPGTFGLDDTHMPDALAKEEHAQIPCLLPGESVTLLQKKWGKLDRYRGPSAGQTLIRFAPRENEKPAFAVWATFTILGAPPHTANPCASAFAQRHPHAFRIGQMVGGLIKRLRVTHD